MLTVLALFPFQRATAFHPVTYEYHIGDAFLTAFDPSFGPDIARAANGDTVEVVGTGTFGHRPDDVTGGGTFVHRNADGEIIATGTWRALYRVSYRSYGSGATQGLPDNFDGGRARLLIEAVLDDNPSQKFFGYVIIDCTLGDSIPSGAVEGVRIIMPGLIHFDESIGGATLFVKL